MKPRRRKYNPRKPASVAASPTSPPESSDGLMEIIRNSPTFDSTDFADLSVDFDERADAKVWESEHREFLEQDLQGSPSWVIDVLMAEWREGRGKRGAAR